MYTMSTLSIKYYAPNKNLIQYLNEQLQYLQNKTENTESRSKSKSANQISRKKSYYMDIIFQAFTDIVYFFEFIERNYEDLNVVFEDDLKDLVGYNRHYSIDEFFPDNKSYRPNRGGIPGGPVMRLVRSILLLNEPSSIHNKLDFRMSLLSGVFISQSLDALLRRFEDTDERAMATQDTNRTLIWARFLAKQVERKQKSSRRRIGYYPYKGKK
jgi:hypothetical protein